LYIKGNFELALVFYHRGQKLKPESEEFRLGIQKAQEAIDSAVGGKVAMYNAKCMLIVSLLATPDYLRTTVCSLHFCIASEQWRF